MEYKKDKLYKFAVGIAIVSIIDMVITFLMMSYSSNLRLILWFFIGGFLLVIANFIMVSVKRKHERVYYEKPSVGEIVKENVGNFKAFLFKRGIVGFFALIMLVLTFAAFAVIGVKTLTTAYQKSGAINAGYHFNLREAERYEGLMEEELEKGNEKLAEEFRLSAEKCREDSQWYLEYHEVLTERLNTQVKYLIVASVAFFVSLSGHIALVVIYKEKQRNIN